MHSTQVEQATDTAYALVTSSLLGDYEAFKATIPCNPEDLVYLTIALSKLSARILESLADERDQETIEMWREVTRANALVKSL